jgi:nitrogen fixation/metabolism regulation signal transduction histidine kinase
MTTEKKFERKHFFIDRKLQGRYMMTFFIPMLIMLLFMIFTLYIAANSLVKTASTIVKMDIQNQITLQFQDEPEPSIQSYKNLLKEINMYLRNFPENKRYRQAVVSSLLWVFGIGILFVIIQLVLLTIFFSHKVAGPVYRFEMTCHDIIDGNYTGNIKLRKGDEMQNLATLLNEVIDRSRERLLGLKNAETDEEKQKIVNSLEL